MENKLVVWFGGKLEALQTMVKPIRRRIVLNFLSGEDDLRDTEKGFKFIFDDETDGMVQVEFEAWNSQSRIVISGEYANDVIEIHNLINSMFFDEE